MIEAMDMQVQAILWDYVNRNGILSYSNVPVEATSHVGQHISYGVLSNRINHTTTRRVLRMYQEETRCVITYAALREDECFPQTLDEVRSHGFACTFIERISESITLVRHSHVYLTPFRAHARVSLEDLGRMVLQTTDGLEHRDAYVCRITSTAERSFATEFQTILQTFRLKLAQQRMDRIHSA
ncbi:Aste57867_773 [Aphanomyces stellatus]|uniref:Aste57867_773 protein n=1 Tax=Aphanomyces stellatus TaxID=120398 RepID=A0A485K8Q5_9STRA|nr:hypothetical protein As57867_000772 [Aphanomyces stellatus]VFT77997.1 Aste57867_773 [Aphanomyces stellatus]